MIRPMSHYPPPQTLLALLRQRGFRTERRIGQHFLIDEAILRRIADLSGVDSETLAVEIGPGPGALTAPLAERAGGVVAVEFDTRLREHHQFLFGESPHVEIIYEDALRVDLHKLARERMKSWDLKRAALTGNLPFQITTPLLFGQTGPNHPWSRMAVMVQKEVADRIAAPPGNREYGIITVKLAYWWKIAERFEVPAAMFHPPPQVDASVLAFEPTDPATRPSAEEWPALSALIDRCFNQRRKKLYNSLHETWRDSPGKEAIRAALERIGVSADARAETLSAENYRRLMEALNA